YTGVWIRGTDPTGINVTINGIPLNDSESQGVFWVNLPDLVSSTSDIQVQRGVGTSTNGAGAFGGTINLNTSKLEREAYARIGASLGSFNTRRANVRFGSGLLNNRFTIDGRISRINSDGYIDRASADLESFYLSGAYVGETSLLRFNVFHGHEITYQAWNGVPSAFVDDPDLRTFNSAGTEKEGEPYDNEVDNYMQTHYQLLYNNQLDKNWNLNLALNYTRGKGFFELYQGDEDLEEYGIGPVTLGDSTITNSDLIERRWLDNHFYVGTYALNYLSNNNRLDVTIGGAYSTYQNDHYGEVIWSRFNNQNEIRDRYYDNDATKRDFNIYTKANYELTYGLNGFIDLQYRRIDYDFLGFNENLENVDQSIALDFFNPKAGLFFSLTDDVDIYASFALAHREPNRNDFTLSTPSNRPKAEKLYNTEIGYRHRFEKAAIGVNVYHMLYRDQLALNGQVNDVGETTRVNLDESYRLGIELVGGVELYKGLRLDANATFSQNKVVAYNEFIDVYDENFVWLNQEMISREDADLPFSPSIVGGLTLSYDALPSLEKHDLNLAWMTRYVGEQQIDLSGDPNNALDAYSFTDFRIEYAIQTNWLKRIKFTVLARNIFDSLYETNAWSYRYRLGNEVVVDQGFYPQAGRNFLVGVNLEF
ncbi:MAG: TonB-dependent receptor, partial [Bacteroidota bacterium]